MGWPVVQDYVDGADRVNAATLNRPIKQLIERTEYLLRLVKAGDHRKVVVDDAKLRSGVQVGQVVYRVPGDGTYAAASALSGEGRWFYADDSAMAVGVVGPSASGSGVVVLYGYVEFEGGIDASSVIVDDAPASGRYFLSTTPGKLTAKPLGPVIYVCDCRIEGGKVTSMLVSPQYRDTGESHVHRAFVVSGKPMGGYSVKTGGLYHAPGILPHSDDPNSQVLPDSYELPDVSLVLRGHWTGDGDVTYTVSVSGEEIKWESSDASEGTGSVDVPDTGKFAAVGTRGLCVGFTGTATDGTKWEVHMPDDARAWVDYYITGDTGDTFAGYRLNLGMYPELVNYVPPVAANGVALPVNGASLTVDGADRNGPVFGDRKGWEITAADVDDESGSGPWLVWYGGKVPAAGNVTATAPFVWDSDTDAQRDRDLVLYLNRMRVGPTGFVTSLQASPGSPLRITSALTGAAAMQGALMLGLDVDFKSAEGNAEGSQVVKRIEGNTFITGQVVERIVEGPGIAVNRQQGTVTISASNAVYAGDFETIALKNAKQDLAGGVFPYTKLVAWRSGSGVTNVRSGFTAKFRVPDFIPYNAGKGYYVVVSTSVFGEEGLDSGASAAFTLVGYSLADQACSVEASGAYSDSIASTSGGDSSTVYVPFADNYAAFDPVLVHGFAASAGQGPGELVLPNEDQRVRDDALWLKASNKKRMVVYPGYFVGVSIERCGVGDSKITPYEPAIGFLSLRWNLVAVQ